MVLNELEYIQKVIEKREKRRYTKAEILMMIKFYIRQNMNIKQVVETINEFMFATNKDYIPERYIDFIETSYKTIHKKGYILSEINKISLTNKEIEIILSLSKLQQQKFLTSIILFAKIKKINMNKTFIGFKELKTVMKFANITLTKKAQDNMITYFEERGFIKSNDDYDNLGIEVLCFKDGVDEFEIIEMENIGKKIDKHIKLHYKGYKQCSECDEVFKPKKTGRPTILCKECSRKENIRKTIENRKKQ